MDISVLKRKMLVKYPFFGVIVSNLNYVSEPQVETAGTDGKTVYYNKEFMENLDISQQIFVMAHEICHIAFNHLLRQENKNHQLWNMATDAVINAFLEQDGLKMVPGVIQIDDAILYDAEELYEKLLKEQQDKEKRDDSKENYETTELNEGENNRNQKGDKAPNEGHDSHEFWEDAVKESKQKQDSMGKKNNNIDNDDQIIREQHEMEKLGEKNAFQENSTLRKKQLDKLNEEITNEIIKQCLTRSNVDSVGFAKPLVDWRYVLRQSINYGVDWSYKNATIEDGVLTPHLETYSIPEVEILLDTSGSIENNLLRNFLRECKNIMKSARVKVGCFDTNFYGFHDITSIDDIDNMKFMGGGGTNYDVAVRSFSKRVQNKIIFTDGFADMPQDEANIIWLVFRDRSIHPKGGRVIFINEEQLSQLYTDDKTKRK